MTGRNLDFSLSGKFLTPKKAHDLRKFLRKERRRRISGKDRLLRPHLITVTAAFLLLAAACSPPAIKQGAGTAVWTLVRPAIGSISTETHPIVAYSPTSRNTEFLEIFTNPSCAGTPLERANVSENSRTVTIDHLSITQSGIIRFYYRPILRKSASDRCLDTGLYYTVNLSLPAPQLDWTDSTGGATHSFGDLLLNSTLNTPESLTLTNSGAQTATQCAPPVLDNLTDFEIVTGTDTCGLADLSPSASCTVQIRPLATGGLGPKTGNLTRACGSVTASIPISSRITAPGLDWSPLTHSFGNVPLTFFSGPQAFTLTNSGTAPATGCSAPVLSNSTDFVIQSDSCSNSNVAPNGGNCTVRVQARPGTAGLRQTTLSRICTVGGTVSTTALGIDATGVTPSLIWSDTQNTITHDFGTVASGTLSPPDELFTLQNVGFATAIDCIDPDLTNSIDFEIVPGSNTCTTAQFPAGGTCTVRVRALGTGGAGPKSTVLQRYCSNLPPMPVSTLTSTVVEANLEWLLSNHSYGNITVGLSSSPHAFTLRNSGAAPAAGCTGPTLSNSSDFTIVSETCGTNSMTAGGTCTVTVVANPQAPGVATTTLSRTCSVGGSPTAVSDSISVTGLTPPSLAWTNESGQSSHSYGSLLQGASPSAFQTFTLTNSGQTDASSCSTPTLNSTDFEFSGTNTCGSTDLPGGNGTCTVQVRALTGGTLGAKTGTLSRTCSNGSASISLSSTLIYPNLSWSPLLYDFGSLAVGSTSTAIFTLNNTGNAEATGCSGAQLASPGSNFTIIADTCTGNLSAGGSCTVTVQAAPQTSGLLSTSLARTCTAGGTATTNTGGITVTGQAPALAWTAVTTSAFGTVEQNTGPGTPLAFDFVNTGNAPATGCSPPLLTNSADFQIQADGCSTGSVPESGGSCQVQVVPLTSGTLGAKTTTLRRTCTGPGIAPQDTDIVLTSTVVDTIPPVAATGLSWSESSPTYTLSPSATWTKSTSGDLANQQIQFYADGTCTLASGSSINLNSNTAQISTFSAPSIGTWSFKITSIDPSGNASASACSNALTILDAPTRFLITGANAQVAGACQRIDFQTANSSNIPTIVDRATSVGVSASGSGAIFSDPGCSMPVSSITVPINTNSGAFYLKDTVSETTMVTLSATGYTNGTLSVSITPDAPYRLVFTTQPSGSTPAGSTITPAPVVQIRDQFGNANSSGTGATDSIRIRTYSDSACTTPSGGSALYAGGTVTAASGNATFSSAQISVKGTYYLGAEDTSQSLGGGTVFCSSSTLTIHAAVASKLAFTQLPGQGPYTPLPRSGVTQVAFGSDTQAPIVQIQDTYGNLIDSVLSAAYLSDSIQLTAFSDNTCSTPASGILSGGGFNTVTASSGTATFNQVYHNTPETIYIKATNTSPGHSSITSTCSTTLSTSGITIYQPTLGFTDNGQWGYASRTAYSLIAQACTGTKTGCASTSSIGEPVGSPITIARKVNGVPYSVGTNAITLKTQAVTARNTQFTPNPTTGISVTVPNGSSTSVVDSSQFSIVANSTLTADTYFTMTLENPTNTAILSGSPISMVNLIDPNYTQALGYRGGGNILFSDVLYSSEVGGSSITLTLQRAFSTNTTETVDVELFDGSGKCGTDYQAFTSSSCATDTRSGAISTRQTVTFSSSTPNQELQVSVPLLTNSTARNSAQNRSLFARITPGSGSGSMRTQSIAKLRILNTNLSGNTCNPSASTPFGGGLGTSSNPYLICSTAQWNRITNTASCGTATPGGVNAGGSNCNLTTVYFKLMADFTPSSIPSAIPSLNANLDGNQYAIYSYSAANGTSSFLGALARATAGTEIKGLNFLYGVQSGATTEIGLLASSNGSITAGQYGSKLTDVLVSGYLSGTGTTNMGLLGGQLAMGPTPTDLTHQYDLVHGTITNYSANLGQIGGYYSYTNTAGTNSGSTILDIKNSFSTMNLNTFSAIAGGFIGNLNFANTTAPSARLEYLVSHGYLAGVIQGMGGIAGVARTFKTTNSRAIFSLSNNSVSGSQRANGHSFASPLTQSVFYGWGGITGSLRCENNCSYVDFKLENNLNDSDIRYTTSQAVNTVGGIAGSISTLNTSSIENTWSVTNNMNTGPITLAPATQIQMNGIGGAFGVLNQFSSDNTQTWTFSTNQNSGAITVSNANSSSVGFGGVVGNITNFFIPSPSFSGSSNSGTIQCMATWCGGVFGSTGSSTTFASSGDRNSGNILASASSGGASGIGGVVGAMYSGSISNSMNSGNITVSGTGSNLVGGFAGDVAAATNGVPTSITRSSSTGNVTATGSTVNSFGGFAGRIHSNSANGSVLITQSWASGTVSSTSSNATYFGGFAGRIRAWNASHTTANVDQCYSSGNVTDNGNSGAGAFGGFAGQINTQNTTASVDVSRSWSTGNVTVTSAVSNSNSAGGFVGDLNSNTGGTLTISNSFAAGATVTGYYKGGFVGDLSNSIGTTVQLAQVYTVQTGTANMKGFVGNVGGLGTKTYNQAYWLTTSGITDASGSGATSVSATDLQDSTYSGFGNYDSNFSTGVNWIAPGLCSPSRTQPSGGCPNSTYAYPTVVFP
ncbi:MAG: choice-of-anchor D domain-containing protein [Proteobacteria bacterium]|nr:choice-of-anchor D domain-containing protein [Pseudomonadota bacterium]